MVINVNSKNSTKIFIGKMVKPQDGEFNYSGYEYTNILSFDNESKQAIVSVMCPIKNSDTNDIKIETCTSGLSIWKDEGGLEPTTAQIYLPYAEILRKSDNKVVKSEEDLL